MDADVAHADAGQSPADAGQSPADTGQSPADAGPGPADAGQSPADTGQGPADAGQGPADAGQGPADAGQGPADAGQGPADAGQGPADADLRQAWETAQQAWLERMPYNTARAYGIAFRQFFEWSGTQPRQASQELVGAWIRHMASKVLAERTINLKLSAMSSFYDFVAGGYRPPTPQTEPRLVLWPAARGNPFKAVARPRVSAYSRVKSPSLEEARAILTAINPECLTGARDFALLLTILVTCRSASQVLGIQRGDIQPLENGGYIFSYRHRGELRWAALNRTCCRAICAYLDMAGRPATGLASSDYIFIPIRPACIQRLPGNADRQVEPNRPLSSSFAGRILKKYARRAGVGLEKAHLHGLRHTGARLRVLLTNRGKAWVDYAHVKKLLGSSSLGMTHDDLAGRDPAGDTLVRLLMPNYADRFRAGTANGGEKSHALCAEWPGTEGA